MALIGSGASRLVRNEVPEPTSALLAGLGMAALVGTRRRKSV
jgi:hypothetical protein